MPGALASEVGDTLPARGGGSGEVPASGPRYEVGELLARGGQSEVYVAFDTHLRREVAWKRPRPDADEAVRPATEARFLREARLTAHLDHPNVITVHEIGRDEAGRLFCTQRLVRGADGGAPTTFARALAACPTLEARLALLPRLLDVCTGVAHAHARGVVHRDLKPDNVVLGGPNETVVLDWGLARDRRAAEADPHHDSSDGLQTLDGQVLGTPLYMSPEQARGDRAAVDERSDVWSLGAMLFELLTGKTPFTGRTPLEVVSAVRDAPVPSPLSLEPKAPRALVAICLRALARAPEQRYPAAAPLAADLRAFLEHRQVQAYAYSLPELVRLFVQRSKTTALVAGVALLLLAAAFAGLLVANQRAAVSLAEAFVEKARLAEAGLRWDEAAIWYAAAFESSGRRDAATGAWLAAQRPAAKAPRRLRGHTRGIKALAASADGALLASAGSDMTVRLWRLPDGTPERVLTGHTDTVTGLALTRDGAALWSVSEDRTVRRWRLSDGSAEVVATLPDRLNALVLVDGDRAALVACEAGELYRVAPGEQPTVFGRHAKPVYALALTPAGDELFSGSYAGEVKRWRVADGALLGETAGHIGSVLALAVSRDGKRLATAGRDTTVRVWDIEAERLAPLHILSGHSQRVYGLAWGEGELLASVGADGTSRVWEGRWGLPIRSESRGEADEFAAARFLPGDTLASAGRSGVISLRQVVAPTLLPRAQMTEAVQLLPDGRLIAAVGDAFAVLDGATLAVLRGGSAGATPAPPQRPGTIVATSTDGRLVIGHCGRSCLAWWDLGEERLLGTTAGHRAPPNAIAVSPDGRLVASVGVEPSVRVFDVATRAEVATLDPHRSGGFGVAFSPDGSLLATSDYDKRISLWRTSDFTELRRLEGHEHGVRSVRFSPDGTRLASVGWDRSARVWRVDTGEELARLYHQDFVFGVAWHPDGRRLATASHDGAVRIWDTVERSELLRFPGDEAQPSAVRFSKDGRVLYYEGRGVHRIELEPAASAPTLAELLAQSGLELSGLRLVPVAAPAAEKRLPE